MCLFPSYVLLIYIIKSYFIYIYIYIVLSSDHNNIYIYIYYIRIAYLNLLGANWESTLIYFMNIHGAWCCKEMSIAATVSSSVAQ